MTVVSVTTKLARLASDTFSRAMSSAPFGRSNENKVTATPVD